MADARASSSVLATGAGPASWLAGNLAVAQHGHDVLYAYGSGMRAVLVRVNPGDGTHGEAFFFWGGGASFPFSRMHT